MHVSLSYFRRKDCRNLSDGSKSIYVSRRQRRAFDWSLNVKIALTVQGNVRFWPFLAIFKIRAVFPTKDGLKPPCYPVIDWPLVVLGHARHAGGVTSSRFDHLGGHTEDFVCFFAFNGLFWTGSRTNGAVLKRKLYNMFESMHHTRSDKSTQVYL
jgi:hypothetical protein